MFFTGVITSCRKNLFQQPVKYGSTIVVLLLSNVFFANAQKEITIENFTDKNVFVKKSVDEISWMNDGKSYTTLSENTVKRYSILTGGFLETILDGATNQPAITIEAYSFSSDERKILIKTNSKKIYRRSSTSEYYLYDLASKHLQALSVKGVQSYATFSPDASKIAFVRNNNLFYVNLANGQEIQVTDDGRFNHIINGTTDWVYEEELSFVQGFAWSPDSKRIAYYRFDESAVKEYTLQKWNSGQLYPENYSYKYPKAGEANSIVSIWLYEPETNKKIKAETGLDHDVYFPKVQWSKNPMILSVLKMNRLQNEIELLHVDAMTGKTTSVLTEKSDTYIDFEYVNEFYYLQNGKQFIHASERSGYKHLYLYAMDGTLVNPITSGNWEVIDMVGVDEKAEVIFYLSTEASHLDSHLYTITFDGKKKSKLTSIPGTHTANFSYDFQFYIDFHNSGTQPEKVTLVERKRNRPIRTLEDNAALSKALVDYGVTPKEFFSCTAADGTTSLDGFMIKPKNFDPSRKHPVLVYQYSGPRSPKALNDFGGLYFYWFQMLAQKGYITVAIDTRGTSAKGEKFVKQTYKQLGKLELEDLLAVGKFLKNLNYVDPERVGIFGWSYGGYTAALVMTRGAGMYKLGIAGAPVTNWRFYDNIYTERYLQRPQDNPAGYDDNSPLSYAKELQGKFLLIHGTGDDNVHFQNAVMLEDALIKADKQFQSFYYPNEAHGIPTGKRKAHLFGLMTDFIVNNL